MKTIFPKILRALLLATSLCCTAPLSAEQIKTAKDQSGRDKIVKILKIETPPIIDGEMDEIWNTASAIEDLHQVQPIEFAVPSEKTILRVLYNDDFLYFSGMMYHENHNDIVANKLIQRSGLRNDDKIRIYINPFNDDRNGYLFQVNANGVRQDAIFENVRSTNFAWESIFYSAVSRTEYGWYAEMAIPFKSISFDPGSDEWGISFFRSIEVRNEDIAWTSYNGNINPSNFGTATDLKGIRQGLGLDIIPGISLTAAESFNPDSSSSNLEPSLDLFYKFTPNLTGALTFNSDFSATSVDNRQVQLTRFSLFFPEQRKFFLQEADIFEFGGRGGNGRPFFSRRIGITDEGEQLDLEAGGKITGRIGDWNVGALAVQQGGNAEIDDSQLFVARAARNVLGQSTIGAIITHGNPTEDRDNSLVGVDFNYLNTRSFDKITIAGQLWYQQSDTEGLSGDESSWGLNIGTPNREGYRGRFSYTSLGEDYFPALGFANRVGIDETFIAGAHRQRYPADSRIRLIDKVIIGRRITDNDGNLETEQIRFFGEIQNQSGDEADIFYNNTTEILTEPFEISDNIIIPVGRYSFERMGLGLETGGQRAVSAELNFQTGEFFSGDRDTIQTTINWNPNKYFNGSLEFEYNDIDLPQGRFNTRLARLQTDIAFNAEWAWLTTTQYDNQSDLIGINSRLQWTPKDGQELFLIYNGGWIDRSERGGFEQVGQSATVKISYTFRY